MKFLILIFLLCVSTNYVKCDNTILIHKDLPFIIYISKVGESRYNLNSTLYPSNFTEVVKFCKLIYKNESISNAVPRFHPVNVPYKNRNYTIHPIECIKSKFNPKPLINPPYCRFESISKPCSSFHTFYKQASYKCAKHFHVLHNMKVNETCKKELMKFHSAIFICCPARNFEDKFKILYNQYHFNVSKEIEHRLFSEYKHRIANLYKNETNIIKTAIYNRLKTVNSKTNLLTDNNQRLKQEYIKTVIELESVFHKYLKKIEIIHMKRIAHSLQKKRNKDYNNWKHIIKRLVLHARKMCSTNMKELNNWNYLSNTKLFLDHFLLDKFERLKKESIDGMFQDEVRQRNWKSNCDLNHVESYQMKIKEKGKQFDEMTHELLMKHTQHHASSNMYIITTVIIIVIFILLLVIILIKQTYHKSPTASPINGGNNNQTCFMFRARGMLPRRWLRGSHCRQGITMTTTTSTSNGSCSMPPVIDSVGDDNSINLYENPVFLSNGSRKDQSKSIEKKSLIENME